MLIRSVSTLSPVILLSITMACNGGEFSDSTSRLNGSGQLPPEISCEDTGTCDNTEPEIITDDPCVDESICISTPTDPAGDPISDPVKNPDGTDLPSDQPVSDVDDPTTDIPYNPEDPASEITDCTPQIDKDGNEFLPDGCDPTQPPTTEIVIDDPTQSEDPSQTSDNATEEGSLL